MEQYPALTLSRAARLQLRTRLVHSGLSRPDGLDAHRQHRRHERDHRSDARPAHGRLRPRESRSRRAAARADVSAFDLYAGNPAARLEHGAARAVRAARIRRAARRTRRRRDAGSVAPARSLRRNVRRLGVRHRSRSRIADGALHARFRGADVGTLEPVQGETFRHEARRPTMIKAVSRSSSAAAGVVAALRAFGITFDPRPQIDHRVGDSAHDLTTLHFARRSVAGLALAACHAARRRRARACFAIQRSAATPSRSSTPATSGSRRATAERRVGSPSTPTVETDPHFSPDGSQDRVHRDRRRQHRRLRRPRRRR